MPTSRNFGYHINATGGISGFNNPGGVTYYVGASGYTAGNGGVAPSNSNTGTSPQAPFSTIQYALDQCVSGRGDIVAVLPGSYTITANLTMQDDDVTLTSAHPVGPRERSPVKIVSATDPAAPGTLGQGGIITIDANDCTVYGIEIDCNVATATADTACIAVNSVSSATDYTNTKIINCTLDMLGADSDMDGIALGLAGDATDGAIGSLVSGCTIIDCDQDAIAIAAGSEHSVVDNCLIYDLVNLCRYGVDVAATNCTVSNCDILCSDTATPGAPIHNGVAAARMVAINNTLHAWGANTTGILAIDTATHRTAGNWITAAAANNLVDYLTASTSPSASADVAAIYAADPGATVFVTPSVAGA